MKTQGISANVVRWVALALFCGPCFCGNTDLVAVHRGSDLAKKFEGKKNECEDSRQRKGGGEIAVFFGPLMNAHENRIRRTVTYAHRNIFTTQRYT